MKLGDMLCPWHPTMTLFQCIEGGLHGPVPDRAYPCPHAGCDFRGTAIEMPKHVEENHAPPDLGEGRYGR
jgi:hypothetical protein